MTVSPASFSGVDAGQAYTLTVVVTANGAQPRQGVSATIWLRDGRRQVPNPLTLRWLPPRQEPPHVDWTPRSITSTFALAPGTSDTTTFTSTQAITNVAVLALRGRDGNIGISPASFDSVLPGRVYSVDVKVTAPLTGRPGISTTVSLYDSRHAVPERLPVVWRPG